jgi:glutamate synthase (NADPH/NADH) small chain
MGKYITKSFAPISNLDEAKVELYKWRDSLKDNSMKQANSHPQQQNFRDEYIDHQEIENDFQFLEVGRFDPTKKTN